MIAVILKILFVRLLFGLFAFALGILGALLGLALELVVVIGRLGWRYAVWPLTRTLGCPIRRLVDRRGPRVECGYESLGRWRDDRAPRRVIQPPRADQAALLAAVRAALATRERY